MSKRKRLRSLGTPPEKNIFDGRMSGAVVWTKINVGYGSVRDILPNAVRDQLDSRCKLFCEILQAPFPVRAFAMMLIERIGPRMARVLPTTKLWL